MERFKAVERETKTKAYSKEGDEYGCVMVCMLALYCEDIMFIYCFHCLSHVDT